MPLKRIQKFIANIFAIGERLPWRHTQTGTESTTSSKSPATSEKDERFMTLEDAKNLFNSAPPKFASSRHIHAINLIAESQGLKGCVLPENLAKMTLSEMQRRKNLLGI